MTASGLTVAIMALVGQFLTHDYGLCLAVLLRYAVPTIILAWLVLLTDKFHMPWRYFKQILIRALFMVACQLCFFYYLMHGSIVYATLFFSTGPLFVPLIAWVAYKVKPANKIWLSLAISFVGVGIAMHPQHGPDYGLAFFGIAAGFFNACSQTVYHKVSHDTSATVTTFYAFVICSILMLIISLFFVPATLWQHAYQHIQLPYQGLLVLAFAFAAISTQIFRGLAYQKVNKANSVAPFMYTSIIFAGLLAWLVYNSIPSIYTIIGTVIIIGGGFIVLHRAKAR